MADNAPADTSTAPSPVLPAPSDPVRLLMSAPVATVDVGASVRDAAEELMVDEVGVVLVTGQGPVGLLSERDVLTLVATGADLDVTQVGDVMSTDLLWARPDDPIRTVSELMIDAGLRHLPIGDGRHPVGIVSLRDVVGVLVAAAGPRA